MFWTPKLCRICACVASISYPIFTNTQVNDIEVKFKKCFSINVFKDDFKPKEICNVCLDKLNDFCQFLELCITSNNKFESILYETNKSEVSDTWQNKIQYKLGSDLFSPTENGVIVKADELLLLKHDANIYITEELDSFEQDQVQNQTVLRHSSEYSEIGLTEFEVEPKKNPSPQPSVPPKVKPFKCTECNKSFMRKLTLKTHMASHTNLKPFQCDLCPKSFAVRWNLTRHKRVHTTLYQCEYCSKTFSVPSKLERHLRIHTNERIFKCEVEGCGKQFTDKRNLVGHQVTHSEIRKFQCDVCEKRYKTKSQLVEHKKVHTDVSYDCEICGKVFKWKANLGIHVKKHTEFHCKKCKVDFRNQSLFLMHQDDCIK